MSIALAMQPANVQQTLDNENEALIKAGDIWLHFVSPHRLIIAQKLEEVLPALREVEQLIEDNDWYAAGFVSYEAASAFDPALQSHQASGSNIASSLNLPFDDEHREDHSLLRSHRPHALSGAREDFPFLWFGLYPPPRIIHQLDKPREEAIPGLNWQPTTDRTTYNAAIEQIRNHIAEGRTYQVNYTMRLHADFTGSEWDFFLRLAQTQNKHAAYINTGRYTICSASPELFFQLDGDTVTCRPMKGTVKRGRTTAEDEVQAQWLKNSEKNCAENVMIVDMIRNDVGRIAKIGSVEVPRLFDTERYPTLWQMTSTVTAKTNASLTQIFTALFPSASITGAPKVGTMKMIAGLETTPRKIYTGSIGYIAPNRKAMFNVAIRTALIDRETRQAEYGVGGGIVWDSTSADEYSEALLKASVLTQQRPPFSLLETLLWTPEQGFFLREKHIERMLDSAHYFDFPVSKTYLDLYLNRIAADLTSPQRVRLLLDQTGALSSEAVSFQPVENPKRMKVRLAKEPIDINNIFLFHKTTNRGVYAQAFISAGPESPQEQGGYDDVLLHNERGELTEFTVGNLVFELSGSFYTPPISCGLLAGTFRAYLVEAGKVAERTIRMEELKNCKKLFMVNSVRKWQEVDLISQPK